MSKSEAAERIEPCETWLEVHLWSSERPTNLEIERVAEALAVMGIEVDRIETAHLSHKPRWKTGTR